MPDGGTFAFPIPGVNVTVDETIHSWSDLAAMETVSLSAGTVIGWVEATTLILKAVILQNSTDATDTAEGLQRPNDYNESTNAKVWHQVAFD